MFSRRVFALVTVPLIICTLLAVAVSTVILVQQPPDSWTLVIAVVVGVILASTYQISLGPGPAAPKVGVGVVMLAIAPTSDDPFMWAGVWAIGFTLSQLILRRQITDALCTAGVCIIAGYGSVFLQVTLIEAGIWPAIALVIATGLYFSFVLGCEAFRMHLSTGASQDPDMNTILPIKVLHVIAIASVAALIMLFVDASMIDLLEHDSMTNRSPFVVLATSLIFFAMAQRTRFLEVQQQLNSVLNAAVELPHTTGTGFTEALTKRAQEIVHSRHAVVRDDPPGRNEIGAPVHLFEQSTQYLVASDKNGNAQFSREDARAIVSLAHAADQATDMRLRVESLEHRANTDTLTGLPNYGAFQHALTDANAQRTYHESIALLFIDLDNFKKLNDNHGHQAGDQLLQEVARRLQEAAGGGDFVSRVGGDEFVVILTGLSSIDQAKESAERIINALSLPLRIDGRDTRPVVSAGLSYSSHRELNPQTLVEDADRTMLKEKRARRNAGISDSSSLSIASHRSTRTNEIVARAIRDDRLMLAFQPIVNITNGQVWAYEALVRYVDPELGPISPQSLVARAKSLGLMNELTEQIITKALTAAEQFYAIDPNVKCITVNLELGQISDAELGQFILKSAAEHPNISLCIELNESSLHSATNDLRRDADRLQRAGVIIALDDYGSDESLVRALVQFPMSILKLDRTLISDLSDPRQVELVKALQSFGNKLEFTTIIEGIENQETVEILKSLGVTNAQGYFFGRPAPAGVVAKSLQKGIQQRSLAASS